MADTDADGSGHRDVMTFLMTMRAADSDS